MLQDMTQPAKSRKEKLQEFVAAHPNDAFAQYGLAIEFAKEGDNDAAVRTFQELLNAHRDYVTGYFQLGQLYAKMGRGTEARKTLQSGIEAANRAGDSHASSEMAAALEELSR
jgi:tetratricopeptide (TPR) repeat protein